MEPHPNSMQLLAQSAINPARPLRSAAPDVPLSIAMLVDRALAFDKANRFGTAREMQTAIADAYRASFGVEISREVLARGASSTGASAESTAPPKPRERSEPFTKIMPAHSPLNVRVRSETTGRPVETVPPAERPRGRAGLLFAAGAAALLCLGIALGYRALSRPDAARAALPESTTVDPNVTAAPAPGTSSATPMQPAEPSAAPLPEPPRSSARAAPPPPATAAARNVPSITQHPSAVSASASSVPVATTAPSAKPSCDPPFYFDSQNRRVSKPECL